ncbi:uncharacterized protein ColSpa_01951 [Colletotrichum spaethianum]|uniref:Uncharacterized protein n=1 Tax=Colletotrichum spaethianum TaxID=700344 RepID=A0AA37L9A7_9PEZI|nr:uncharacterized protein ColSpa_01951 [Colletotrichum spaethianum]GKT41770.1 hypothetical protein ColSpa_01951 [Colletotrichum spaethianum]
MRLIQMGLEYGEYQGRRDGVQRYSCRPGILMNNAGLVRTSEWSRTEDRFEMKPPPIHIFHAGVNHPDLGPDDFAIVRIVQFRSLLGRDLQLTHIYLFLLLRDLGSLIFGDSVGGSEILPADE